MNSVKKIFNTLKNNIKAHYVVIGVVVVGLVIAYYFYKREHFTRTCITGDTSATFVRSPVDYAYEDITEIPMKVGMKFPHFLGKPTDDLQPLEGSHGVDLTEDMTRLADGALFKQYENDWPGCGNGMPYIVNDSVTRDQLTRVGDMDTRRKLDAEVTPYHVKADVYPVLPELAAVRPDGYERLYGGEPYIHDTLRVY